MSRSTSNARVACVTTWLALAANARAEAPAATDDLQDNDTSNVSASLDAMASVDRLGAELPRDESLAAKPAENAIYLELLGTSLFSSLNYERVILDAMAVRVGFSCWPTTASAGESTGRGALLMVPITVSYIGVGGLEVGAGATLLHATAGSVNIGGSATSSGVSALGSALVGYRLHPRGEAGFQLRVGGLIMMGQGMVLRETDPSSFGVLPWFYLSLGAGF